MMSVRLVLVLGVLLALSIAANAVQLWWFVRAEELIGGQLAKIEQRDAQITQQNDSIKELEEQGKTAMDRLTNAESRAAGTRLEADGEAIRLLSTDVPADCHGAIGWAAETGLQLGATWEK